ncbi:uncharacterized protein BX664DRAFT_90356 [Halteromyces radiatus]|uniref:uncharacterized protein n=1 Tax=Halteromyces radiatus TaxID=101107 RepID=UPI0022205551|nr:uncharacterized protein BX664DRAFT_90356 [Halteromyces radiatus]KAI8092585.1 hypothetical protein BX664DRAFT_90356 [Halteromyces radiatus]
MNRSIRHCRCGSTTHLRTSHYECPLNQNKQPTAHNSSVNLCRCGSDTHSRTTHYDCPLNRSTRRRYEDCQVHQGSHQLHGDSNQRVSSSLICSRCGRRGHSSAHNRSCPFNKLNIINERLGAQYNQAASSISFVPESVFGSYVRDDQGPNYHRHLLPPFETICSTSGALMCIEERLQSATSTRLQFSLCCSNGKINLPLPTPPPEEMLSMLLGDRTTNETIADFHTNIRSYNTLFAFASTVANVDQSLLWQGSNRPTTFRINGTIYHCIGALRSNNYQQSNFSQASI